MSFVLHRPDSVAQAVQLGRETGGSYLAGGTVSMVNYNKGLPLAAHLIDLGRIASLEQIEETTDEIFIGARVTFDAIERSELLQSAAFALWQAAREVGGPQVRNRATIGGNLCAASPSADAATPLLALGAELELCSAEGTRRIPLDGFFTGPGKTVRAESELLTRVILPKNSLVSRFCKVGKRNALAVSCVNLAVAARVEHGALHEVSVAVGAAAPTAVRCKKTAQLLEGKSPDAALLAAAQAQLLTEIAPIDDRWATAAYRRTVAQNLLAELTRALCEKEGI